MEFYELCADKKDFFIFDIREIVNTPPHFHGSVEMLFVKEGEQKVVIDGNVTTLKTGEGCFSDCFSVHSYVNNPLAKSYIIILSRQLFEKVISPFDGEVPPEFFTFKNFDLLNNLHDFCNKPFKDDKNKGIALLGAMEILFSQIKENNLFVKRDKSRRSLLVKDILTYAQENLSENLSLNALSKKYNYSKEHLSRLLHKYLSENWVNYINRLRVDKAHFLIENNPEISILDISLNCGFESLSTFYRAYKREYGEAPRQEH